MGKKWKVAQENEESAYDSGNYNAVHYVYDTRLLARPTGVAKYSKAMQLFRDGVKRNAQNAPATTNGIKFEPAGIAKEIDPPSDTVDDENSTCDIENVQSETKTKKKKKKSKKAENESVDEQTVVENGEVPIENDEALVSKKKKKSKSKRDKSPVQNGTSEVNLNAQVIEEEHTDNTKKQKKKKKNKSKDKIENDKIEEDRVQMKDIENSESTEVSKKKKKKKKNKDENIIDEAKTDAVELQNESENATDAIIDNDNSSNKKKKKKKSKEVPDECTETGVNDVEAEQTSKSKKKKKKEKRKLENTVNADSDTPPTKKKRSDSNVVSELDVDNISNKKQNKDKEDVDAGQWGSVTLGDDSRTNKFLRLMGGKNAAKGSTTKTPVVKSKFNKAMDNEQAQKLDSALENQYVKAKQDILIKGRGVGLGFEKPPGEGKKFFIDTNQSKSKKFDD